MKTRISILTLSAAVILMAGCTKENPTDPTEYDVTVGALILNNGTWGMNDSNISFFDFENWTVEEDVFEKANSYCLGDLAQDIMAYGSKVYVSVSGSGIIFVMDRKTFKTVGNIVEKKEDTQLSPRCFAAKDKYLYVTYYEGYVGKIDTASLSVVNLVKVGDNPEGITQTAGRLFVANSGGMNYPNYGTTLSVIDISTMEVIREIEVGNNPMMSVADAEGDLYVLARGNYGDDPGHVMKVDPLTFETTTILGTDNPFVMAMGADNKIYILVSKYDENWNVVNDIVVLDANGYSEKLIGSYITDGSVVENPGSLSADPVSGMVFIGCSDYIHTGSISVYDGGTFVTSFTSGGMNPQKVEFLNE